MNFNEGLYNMYREVDELVLLNKLFASLICEDLNLKNYATNVVIEHKTTLKDTIEELSFTINNANEDIKNLIKIKKGYPVYKIDDIELISTIKTNVSGDYKESTVIENIKTETNILLKLIKDIIMQAEADKNYEIISVLSSISYNLKTSLLNMS